MIHYKQLSLGSRKRGQELLFTTGANPSKKSKGVIPLERLTQIANTGDHQALEALILNVTKRNPALTFGSIRDSLTSEGQTCLNRLFLFEVSQNNLSSVQRLIELGAALDAREPSLLEYTDDVPNQEGCIHTDFSGSPKPKTGNTAFHIAACGRYNDLLSLLCEQANCDSNIPLSQKPFNLSNFFGETPLHVAADCLHHDCLNTLILAGADTTRQTLFGSSSLGTLLDVRDRLLKPSENPFFRMTFDVNGDLIELGNDKLVALEQAQNNLRQHYHRFLKISLRLWSIRSRRLFHNNGMEREAANAYSFYTKNHPKFILLSGCFFKLIRPFVDQFRQQLLSKSSTDIRFQTMVIDFMTEAITRFRVKPTKESIMGSLGILDPGNDVVAQKQERQFGAYKAFSQYGFQLLIDKQAKGALKTLINQEMSVTEILDLYSPSIRTSSSPSGSRNKSWAYNMRAIEALYYRVNNLQNKIDSHNSALITIISDL